MQDMNGHPLKVGDFVRFKSLTKFLAVIANIYDPKKVPGRCTLYYKNSLLHSYFSGAVLLYTSPEEAAIILLEE